MREMTSPFLLAERVGSERPSKPHARKPSFFVRWRLWLVLIALIVLLPTGYVLYGMGDTPRYVYIVHETKLIVDGEAVTLTGVLECERSPLFLLGGLSEGRPYQMLGSPAAAVELSDGGAVVVGFPDLCGEGRRPEYEPGYFPATYLVDSATAPTRMDHYFSDLSLDDPKSRVRFVAFSTERSSSPIRSYSLLWRHRWSRPFSSAVPGLVDDSALYLGYLMTVASLSDLPDEERTFLMANAEGQDGILRFVIDSPERREPALNVLHLIDPTVFGLVTGSACQSQSHAGACERLRRTFGVPIVDGVPTVDDIGALIPYADLQRRPGTNASVDRSFARAMRLAEINIITFSLFGETVEVSRGDFERTIFVAPSQNVVFGLDTDATSSPRIQHP
jgi:hypothetical protein